MLATRSVMRAMACEAVLSKESGDVWGSSVLSRFLSNTKTEEILPIWKGARLQKTILPSARSSSAERESKVGWPLAESVLASALAAIEAPKQKQQQRQELHMKPVRDKSHGGHPHRSRVAPRRPQLPAHATMPARGNAGGRMGDDAYDDFDEAAEEEMKMEASSGDFLTARSALARSDAKRKFSDRRAGIPRARRDPPPVGRPRGGIGGGGGRGGPRPFKAPAFRPPGRIGEPSRRDAASGRVQRGRGRGRGRMRGNGRGAVRGPPSRAGTRFDPAASAVNAMRGGYDRGAQDEEEDIDPRLKGLDPTLIERIENEVLDLGEPITFDDIAGLEFAKGTVEELVIWPIQNPELFTGLPQASKRPATLRSSWNGKNAHWKGNCSRVQSHLLLNIGLVAHIQVDWRRREDGAGALWSRCGEAAKRGFHRRD